MKIIHIFLCVLSLYASFTTALAQQGEALTIAGTVVNEAGEPLSSVSIYIKDKATTGTSTNADGEFSINVV